MSGARIGTTVAAFEQRLAHGHDLVLPLPEALLEQGFSARLTGQMDVSLAANRIALLKRKTGHLLRHGFLERAFDFGAMIDHGPLNRAMARQPQPMPA